MKTVDKPKVVNIRNPIAIDRIQRTVASGEARNLSEAAENLVLAGFDSLRSTDAHPSPAPAGDTRGGNTAPASTG